MLAMLMQTLDSTIANVALPYMQGSMSASRGRDHLGSDLLCHRRRDHDRAGRLDGARGSGARSCSSAAWWASPSPRCCAARRRTLEQMVGFRLMQGMCGAAIAPLSQATMLDIYPFSKRAQAMAIFSMGVTMGPIMGPTLGGYLTDTYSWRYVFYVNLPFGILAIIGLMLFMPKTPPQSELRFSWYGFAALALGCGALQLMLDRGQELDWFSSREIIVEAVIAGLGFYLFIVHMLTADKPFLSAGPVHGPELRPRHGDGVLRVVRDAGDGRRCWRRICRTWPAIRSIPPDGRWRRAAWARSCRCSWPAGWACGSISARSWPCGLLVLGCGAVPDEHLDARCDAERR